MRGPTSLSDFRAPLLVLLFVIVGVVLTQTLGLLMGWWVALIGIIGPMLLGNPKVFIWLILIFSGVQALAQGCFGPFVKYLDEGIFLGLGVLIMGHVALDSSFLRKRDMKRYLILFFALFCLVVFSGLLNGTSKVNLFHFIKSYLLFGGFFIVARHFFDGRDAKNFIKYFTFFILLQIVLNIGWWLGINPLPNPRGYSAVDFSIGTVGGANSVAYLIIMFLFVLYGLFNSKVLRNKVPILAMGGLSLIAFFLTHTMHAYIFLAICFLIYSPISFRSASPLRAAIIIAIIVAPLLLLVNQMTANKQYGSLEGNALTQKNLEYRWLKMTRGPKAESYADSFWHLPNEKFHYWIVGAGPARYMSVPARLRPTPLALKYLGDFYLTHSGREERRGGSITQNPLVGVCALFGELGLIGIFLYLSLYALPLYRVVSFLKAGLYRDAWQRILAQALVPSLCVYLGLNLLVDYFANLTFVILLWVWIAIVWNPIEPLNERGEKQDKNSFSTV